MHENKPQTKEWEKDQETTSKRKKISFLEADLQIYTQTRKSSNPQQFKGELHKHKKYFTREKKDPDRPFSMRKQILLIIPLMKISDLQIDSIQILCIN